MKLILSTTAALLIGTTGAMAQGFTGATVGLDYTDFNDIDGLSSTLFFGSAEFEVSPGFSVAADLSIRNFEDFDETANNFVVHGIYAVSPDIKVGAFLGRETVEDTDIDNYGVEVAYASPVFGGEAYLGAGEVNGTDLTYFGLSGDYALGNGFSVLGAYDSVNIDLGIGDGTYSTIEIGGQYEVMNGAAFFAKLGQIRLDDGGFTEEENYYALGATFSFGPQGGTTFGPRGLFNTLPFSL